MFEFSLQHAFRIRSQTNTKFETSSQKYNLITHIIHHTQKFILLFYEAKLFCKFAPVWIFKSCENMYLKFKEDVLNDKSFIEIKLEFSVVSTLWD